MNIAVAISVHGAYLQYLPDAIASVEAQTVKPVEKWLLCDGCASPELPAGWKVLTGNHGTPGPIRTEAIRQTGADWIAWLDADDAYPPDYLARLSAANPGHHVGVMYPDLSWTDAAFKEISLMEMREFDRDTLRSGNFIPTPSCWRVQMLRDLGGWGANPCLDDWRMALAGTRQGWNGLHISGAPLLIRRHGDNRSADLNRMRAAKWNAREFAIVTLHSGLTALLPQWLDWLTHAEIPPQCSLWVGDNSGDDKYGKLLRAGLARDDVAARFKSIHYHRVPSGIDCAPGINAPHSRVPGLYNQFLADACRASDLLLMLEDDMLPPLDGLPTLAAAFLHGNNAGAVAGVYLSRGGGSVALSRDAFHWRGSMRPSDIRPGINEIGQVPGGFTLFDSRALLATLPFRWCREAGGSSDGWVGWDGNACRMMHEAGWKLYYHGGVLCEHHCATKRYGGWETITRMVMPGAKAARDIPKPAPAIPVMRQSGLKIHVAIICHSQPDTTDALYRHLSECFDVSIIDSGSEPLRRPRSPHERHENIYWTGCFNEALKKHGACDVLWVIGGDCTATMTASKYRDAINSAWPFGVWSPSIVGRCRRQMARSGSVPREVDWAEGIAMAVAPSLLAAHEGFPAALSIGWGCDVLAGHWARKDGRRVLVDDRVSVNHPPGTGYSQNEARKQMDSYFLSEHGCNWRDVLCYKQ